MTHSFLNASDINYALKVLLLKHLNDSFNLGDINHLLYERQNISFKNTIIKPWESRGGVL